MLLLGVTNHLGQNVASIPFLWVVPFSLYLLSYILAFRGSAYYPRAFFLPLLALSIPAMEALFLRPFLVAPLRLVFPVFCVGLFVGCMVCHGELARRAPLPRHLTRYYLAISTGGALGGIFVGVAAPLRFRATSELHFGIAFCAFLALASLILEPNGTGWARLAQGTLLAITGAASLAIAATLLVATIGTRDVRMWDRNFYGMVKVTNRGNSGDPHALRSFIHGSIHHGVQFLDASMRREPIDYFHRVSGVVLALRSKGRGAPLRVGVIGLGAAVIAAYGRPGNVYRFYEINPLVIEIAHTQFTYLRDCPAG